MSVLRFQLSESRLQQLSNIPHDDSVLDEAQGLLRRAIFAIVLTGEMFNSCKTENVYIELAGILAPWCTAVFERFDFVSGGELSEMILAVGRGVVCRPNCRKLLVTKHPRMFDRFVDVWIALSMPWPLEVGKHDGLHFLLTDCLHTSTALQPYICKLLSERATAVADVIMACLTTFRTTKELIDDEPCGFGRLWITVLDLPRIRQALFDRKYIVVLSRILPKHGGLLVEPDGTFEALLPDIIQLSVDYMLDNPQRIRQALLAGLIPGILNFCDAYEAANARKNGKAGQLVQSTAAAFDYLSGFTMFPSLTRAFYDSFRVVYERMARGRLTHMRKGVMESYMALCKDFEKQNGRPGHLCSCCNFGVRRFPRDSVFLTPNAM